MGSPPIILQHGGVGVSKVATRFVLTAFVLHPLIYINVAVTNCPGTSILLRICIANPVMVTAVSITIGLLAIKSSLPLLPNPTKSPLITQAVVPRNIFPAEVTHGGGKQEVRIMGVRIYISPIFFDKVSLTMKKGRLFSSTDIT